MRRRFPLPVLERLIGLFREDAILTAERAIASAEQVRRYRPADRDYWDEQIWRLKDALFTLQHPVDPNPMPHFRLF